MVIDFTKSEDLLHIVTHEEIEVFKDKFGSHFTELGFEVGDEAMSVLVENVEEFKQRRQLMYQKIAED